MTTPNILRKTAILTLLASFAFMTALSVAPATFAATSPTPNGYCGALNMVMAVGVGAQGGMAYAMSVDNANGNTGMGTAVGNSACS